MELRKEVKSQFFFLDTIFKILSTSIVHVEIDKQWTGKLKQAWEIMSYLT